MGRCSVLIALAFLGTLAPESTPTAPPMVVHPGEGIGPFRLRLGLEGLLQAIGTEGMERRVMDLAQATRGCTVRQEGFVLRFTWRAMGLWLTADAATRRVRVLSAFGVAQGYVTDRGVRLGMPLAAAERAYPEDRVRIRCAVPEARGQAVIVRYPHLGIQFTAAEGGMLQGRIFEIGVFLPGTFP
jgi:hypothetical protein